MSVICTGVVPARKSFLRLHFSEADKRASRALRARNPRKSPKRVWEEYPGAGSQKCRTIAPRSLKRVRKESESQVLDSFRTLLRLWRALFRHFWDPAPGYSFRTLFGLFRETLCGAGPIASLFLCVLSQEYPKDPVILKILQQYFGCTPKGAYGNTAF